MKRPAKCKGENRGSIDKKAHEEKAMIERISFFFLIRMSAAMIFAAKLQRFRVLKRTQKYKLGPPAVMKRSTTCMAAAEIKRIPANRAYAAVFLRLIFSIIVFKKRSTSLLLYKNNT